MDIIFKPKFKKKFKKLSPLIQDKFGKRLQLLVCSRESPALRIHTLKGKKYPLQSMNITGDYRALFIITKDSVTFYEIGTHSELYE